MARKVHLFALSTCGHCRNTKALLDELGVDYTCLDVDQTSGEERMEAVADVKKYNPELSFPTLIIDDDVVIVGFKKNDIVEALKKQ